jgi:DNA invertase Pin-like site-specific DNA recombinase
MALIGYARVSTLDQNPEGQIDALRQAGVTERLLFIDHASGTLASRPEFDNMLRTVREGDVLVITKLDRLARSLKHLLEVSEHLRSVGAGLKVIDQGIDTTTAAGRLLFQILGAIAEFEHSLTVERTRAGLAAARARGRKGGRKSKMTPTRIAQARKMYDAKEHTVQEIADTFGVDRATIYRAIKLES